MNKIKISALAMFAFAICAPNAFAENAWKPICPKIGVGSVKVIEIFDGKPEELAYLLPDRYEKGVDVFTLKDIYTQGRKVTVRCKYDEGKSVDVVLNQTSECRARRMLPGNIYVSCK